MCAFRYVTTRKWLDTIIAQLQTLCLEHVPKQRDRNDERCNACFVELVQKYVGLLEIALDDHYYMRLHVISRIDALLEHCLCSNYFTAAASICYVNKIRSNFWQALPQMRKEYEKNTRSLKRRLIDRCTGNATDVADSDTDN